MNKSSENLDHQSKILLNKVSNSEKNSLILGDILTNLLKKENKVVDKTDELAQILKFISQNESQNSLEAAAEKLSTSFTILADLKQLMIERVEDQVLAEFKPHEIMCKSTREEIQNLLAVKDREVKNKRQLEINKKIRKQGGFENEMMQSNIQISKAVKEMQAIAKNFEHQSIVDFKEILMNFALIQMKFHASALEIYGEMYRDIQKIDEKMDVEQLKKKIHEDPHPKHSFKFGSLFSKSTSNLDTIGGKRFTKKFSNRKSQSITSLNASDLSLRKESYPIDVSENQDEESSTEETETTESGTLTPRKHL